MTVIAACQLALAIGDPEANRAAAAAAVAQAADSSAEIVVLPELCDSGYVFSGAAEAHALAERAGGSQTLRLWQALAARHSGPATGVPGPVTSAVQ